MIYRDDTIAQLENLKAELEEAKRLNKSYERKLNMNGRFNRLGKFCVLMVLIIAILTFTGTFFALLFCGVSHIGALGYSLLALLPVAIFSFITMGCFWKQFTEY